jgi:hypothetical protein
MSFEPEEITRYEEKLSGLEEELRKAVAVQMASLVGFYSGPVPEDFSISLWNDSRIKEQAERIKANGGNWGYISKDYLAFVCSKVDEVEEGFQKPITGDVKAKFIDQVFERVKNYKVGDGAKRD